MALEYIVTQTDTHRVEELPPAPPAPCYRIAVGAFYDRFGANKWPILASTDASVKALVLDTSVRRFIDLQRSDLGGALDLLIAKGFAIDKTAILNTPCQPGEES